METEKAQAAGCRFQAAAAPRDIHWGGSIKGTQASDDEVIFRHHWSEARRTAITEAAVQNLGGCGWRIPSMCASDEGGEQEHRREDPQTQDPRPDAGRRRKICVLEQ